MESRARKAILLRWSVTVRYRLPSSNNVEYKRVNCNPFLSIIIEQDITLATKINTGFYSSTIVRPTTSISLRNFCSVVLKPWHPIFRHSRPSTWTVIEPQSARGGRNGSSSSKTSWLPMGLPTLRDRRPFYFILRETPFFYTLRGRRVNSEVKGSSLTGDNFGLPS